MQELNINGMKFPIEQVRVRVPEIDMPVGVRLHTTDPNSFKQIFVDRELDIALPFTPRTILDAGAYVGYASVWYSWKYPEARIAAVEPNRRNIDLLEANIDVQEIEYLHAAVWYQQADLGLFWRTGRHETKPLWEAQVTDKVADDDLPVKGLPIDELMLDWAWLTVDLLKLDIEGAELDIFQHDCSRWLPRTNAIVVETHDRFRPGCTDAILAALNPGEWTHRQRAERNVFVRKTLVGF